MKGILSEVTTVAIGWVSNTVFSEVSLNDSIMFVTVTETQSLMFCSTSNSRHDKPSCCQAGYFVNQVHLAGQGKGTLNWALQSSQLSLKLAEQCHFVNTPPASPALLTFWLSHFIQVRIFR